MDSRPPSSSSRRTDDPHWPASASTALSASSSAPAIRSASRASTRPASSASLRPSPSVPIRSDNPPTRSASALSVRPSSSASVRPASRLTQRPGSRLARPASRQSSRLLPFYKALVTQVGGINLEDDPDNFRMALEFVSKNLDQTARPSVNADVSTVDKHVRGHIQKAQITSHDTLAVALETAQKELHARAQQPDDLDSEIKTSRLPNHLQLLLLLSVPPTEDTLRIAEEYMERIRNPPKPAPTLTWNEILAEEPFEGQHWEGVYGLPPGAVVGQEDSHSGGSTPSLSPWDDSDLDDSLSLSDVLDLARQPSPPAEDGAETDIRDKDPGRRSLTYGHRQDVEDLKERQYWRAEWHTDAQTSKRFDIGDASTLGPSIRRALAGSAATIVESTSQEKYINEHDAVREVLMALQGRKNIVMTWTHSGEQASTFVPSSTVRLLHLSPAAQLSIISSFANTSTTLEHLRKFVHAVYAKASRAAGNEEERRPSFLAGVRKSMLTLEAFSAAVDSQMRAFNQWCAIKEEAICLARAGIGAPLVVSLLSLDKAIRDEFSAAFDVLLGVLQTIVKRALRQQDQLKDIWLMPDLPIRLSSSAFSACLLDTLLDAVQDHISMGDAATSAVLARVFAETAEPVWTMAGRWMKDGMPVREVVAVPAVAAQRRTPELDDEFFVEDNEMPMLDPDFWADGFVLRGAEDVEGPRASAVPTFLAHVAQLVLDTGKAIGLLRALGVPSVFDREVERQWMSGWRSFGSLLAAQTPLYANTGWGAGSASSVTMSTDQLSAVVYDEILPHSTLAHEMLQRVLLDDCELWRHLSAMEDLYLMRRGDAMSNFVDKLFVRMDNKQAWNDFHFLNTAFRDVATSGPPSQRWIDASLVRFSYRGGKDKSIARTVRAIDGLLVEYAVPFPLTYIFGPRVLQVYSAMFCFVLQVKRAKSVLERILVRGAGGLGGEMKVFYVMRSKLSWFVNTLLSFVSTNVLHAQVLNFHDVFRQAKSLNDMIKLHDEHLSKIEGRCLLRRNTSALQRAIISILDMALAFSEAFTAFAGDTTHDISRHSIVLPKAKRHRSRRARCQRKNVIGFAHSLPLSDSSSESDEEREEDFSAEASAPEPSFSLAASSMSAPDEGFVDRLDKMSSELDTLVRFIRRGVESLAAGTGEAASAFGMFAFALEDWDR